MPEFNVTWTIDVNADSALEAARIALVIQQDPASIATVFTVTNNDETCVSEEIDLSV